MSILREWGYEFSIPLPLIVELERRYGLEGTAGVANTPDAYGMKRSEAYAQSQVILEAPKFDCLLTRNNKGVLPDATGRAVRFGLFNETPARGKRMRSWDLVGFRKRLITQAMVGTIIGQFVGREIKEPGWTFGSGDREHEEAQLRCTEIALSYGCDVGFATGPGTFKP